MTYSKLRVFLSSGILAGVWANFFYQVNIIKDENFKPEPNTIKNMEEMHKVSHIVL